MYESLHAGRQAVTLHNKTMVLAGDFDLARVQIFYRVIGPPMAMVHFRGGSPEGQRQHLVAQAYAKNWFATLHQGLDGGHGVDARGPWIARSVR